MCWIHDNRVSWGSWWQSEDLGSRMGIKKYSPTFLQDPTYYKLSQADVTLRLFDRNSAALSNSIASGWVTAFIELWARKLAIYSKNCNISFICAAAIISKEESNFLKDLIIINQPSSIALIIRKHLFQITPMYSKVKAIAKLSPYDYMGIISGDKGFKTKSQITFLAIFFWKTFKRLTHCGSE